MPRNQGGFGGAESWETAIGKGKSGVGEMVVRVCIVCIDDMIDDIDIDRYCIAIRNVTLRTIGQKYMSLCRFQGKGGIRINT